MVLVGFIEVVVFDAFVVVLLLLFWLDDDLGGPTCPVVVADFAVAVAVFVNVKFAVFTGVELGVNDPVTD